MEIGCTYRVKVNWVIDGDTVDVLWQGNKYRVRLYGIDAPELEQAYGPEAAEALHRMLGGNEVLLEVTNVDRYGRVVGLIYYADRHRQNSINLRMVRDGHAYAYTRYGGAELGFTNAEGDARHGRRGVWRQSRQGGERPWDFRRQQRSKAPVDSGGCLLWFCFLTIAVIFLFWLVRGIW